MKVSNPWRVTLAVPTLACILIGAAAAQELPEGAKVGIWRLNPKARLDQVLTFHPGEFSADFKGDGKPYKILFYTLPAPLGGCRTCRSSWFDVISPEGVTMWRYGVMWPQRCGFVATAQFYDPTGVHHILQHEPPMVVSFPVVGASAGGILNIFRWNRQTGALEDVSGPWNEVEQVDAVRFEDLNSDGNKQIVIEHHTVNSVTRFGPQSVYRWNGKNYQREDVLPAKDKRRSGS